MGQYIVRRLLLAALVVWMVSTFVFFATRVLPGDYAAQQVATSYFSGAGLADPAAALKAARQKLGTDKPLEEQYLRYMAGLVRGDFGDSFRDQSPAFDTVGKALPYSLELGFLTALIAMFVGLPLGVLSAVRQDSLLDGILRVVAILGLAAPSFFTATVATLLVLRFHLFTIDIVGHPTLWDDPIGSIRLVIVPAVAGGLAGAAILMRFVRSQLIDVLSQDFIRTARAKGLSGRTVTMQHALRNALIPVVTVFGFILAGLVSGEVILEQMFNVPGMGQHLYLAIVSRDLPVVQAMVFVITVGIVLMNVGIDLLYPIIDPRVKIS